MLCRICDDELKALREVRDAARAVEEVLSEQEDISAGIRARMSFPALDDLRIALEKARCAGSAT